MQRHVPCFHEIRLVRCKVVFSMVNSKDRTYVSSGTVKTLYVGSFGVTVTTVP